MGLNVIDFKQLNATIDGMEQSSTKLLLQTLLPAFQVGVQTLSDHVQDRLDATTGDALNNLTAERKEALAQLFDGLHGLLDRINWPGVILPRKSQQS